MDYFKLTSFTCLYNYDNRYKNAVFHLNFIMPYNKHLEYVYFILTFMLTRRNKQYPDMGDLGYHLDDLYETRISSEVSILDKNLSVKFVLSFFNPKFIGSSTYLKECLKVFRDCLFDPLLKEEDFVADLKLLIDDAKMQMMKKAYTSRLEFYKEYMKDDILSAYYDCNIQEYESITFKEVLDAYALLLKCSVMGNLGGNISKDDFCNAYCDVFQGLNLVNAKSSDIIKDNYVTANLVPSVVIKKAICKQSYLYLGYKQTEEIKESDFYAFILFCACLGGYFHSTLNLVIREKLGLAYSIYAHYNFFKRTFFVKALISSENYDTVRSEVLNIIKNYQEGLIDEETFSLSKKAIFNELRMNNDVCNVNSMQVRNHLLNIHTASVDDKIKTYNSVTISDLVRIAKVFKLDTTYFLKGEDDE